MIDASTKVKDAFNQARFNLNIEFKKAQKMFEEGEVDRYKYPKWALTKEKEGFCLAFVDEEPDLSPEQNLGYIQYSLEGFNEHHVLPNKESKIGYWYTTYVCDNPEHKNWIGFYSEWFELKDQKTVKRHIRSAIKKEVETQFELWMTSENKTKPDSGRTPKGLVDKLLDDKVDWLDFCKDLYTFRASGK